MEGRDLVMSQGPSGTRTRGTIVPRPGVTCSLVFVYEPVDPSDINFSTLSERKVASIQSSINERFAEPEEMGDVAITFRSDVDVRPGFFIVSTTVSSVIPETIEEMRKIVERETGVDIETFQISAEMRRKTMEMDFL